MITYDRKQIKRMIIKVDEENLTAQFCSGIIYPYISDYTEAGQYMKEIILVRHSIPDRCHAGDMPLTKEGRAEAEKLLMKLNGYKIKLCVSSDIRRADETAEIMFGAHRGDKRLRERECGEVFEKSDWIKQYDDTEYKTSGGETFREVGERMGGSIADILSELREGESAAAVTHAAAICAYLISIGADIVVTDAKEKKRRITFGGEQVHDGSIKTPSAFIVSFDDGKAAKVAYIE